MLTQKSFDQPTVTVAPCADGPRIGKVETGAVRAANAGRLGAGDALQRRLRRQRRRARAGLRSRTGWSIGLW